MPRLRRDSPQTPESVNTLPRPEAVCIELLVARVRVWAAIKSPAHSQFDSAMHRTGKTSTTKSSQDICMHAPAYLELLRDVVAPNSSSTYRRCSRQFNFIVCLSLMSSPIQFIDCSCNCNCNCNCNVCTSLSPQLLSASRQPGPPNQGSS